MLSPDQSFLAGFLTCCRENGLSGEQTKAAMLKTAALLETLGPAFAAEALANLGNPVALATDSAGGVVRGVGDLVQAGAVDYPSALGALGGKAIFSMAHADDPDVDDLKTIELINEYRRQAEAVRKALASQTAAPSRF